MTSTTQSAAQRGDAVALPGIFPAAPVDFGMFLNGGVATKPEHLESAEAAEQLPVFFWLVEALHPGSIVDVGTTDASGYFAMCQGAVGLPNPVELLLGGVALDPSLPEHRNAFERWIETQKHSYGHVSRIVGGGPDDIAQDLEMGSVDILVMHAGASPEAELRQWKDRLWPKLSTRAVVVLDGLNVGGDELFLELAAERPFFRFTHGTGLGIVATGSESPALIRYLNELRNEPEVAATVSMIFERLGDACKHQVEQRLIEQATDELATVKKQLLDSREESGLRAARLVGREAEILSLREQLDWFRNELRAAEQKLAMAQEERRREADWLRDELGAAEGKLAKAQEKLHQETQRRKAMQDGHKELKEAKRRIQNLIGDRARMRVVLKREKEAGIRLSEELQAIYASRSWALTAPLRKVMQLWRSTTGA